MIFSECHIFQGFGHFPGLQGSNSENFNNFTPKLKRRLLQKSNWGVFPNKFPGEFCRGFFGPFFLWKKGGKNPPKMHGKIQIRIWEFRGQNPHCKNLPLPKVFSLRSCRSSSVKFFFFNFWEGNLAGILRRDFFGPTK